MKTNVFWAAAYLSGGDVFRRNFKYLIYSILCGYAFRRSVRICETQALKIRKKKIEVLPGAKLFCTDELKKKKKSDRIYIIGSSDTIGSVTDEEWSVIEANDSLSLNFNIMMPFVPTFYMFEMPSDKERKRVFLRWLNKRCELYREKEVCVLVRSFLSEGFCKGDIPEILWRQCYIADQLSFNAPTKRSLKRTISFFEEFRAEKPQCLPTYKASLFTACYLSYILGYKEVVLVGFELNSTGYFYESDAYAMEDVPETGQAEGLHKTAMRNDLGMPIDEALYVLNESLLKPVGIKLSVASESSLLTRFLDYSSVE